MMFKALYAGTCDSRRLPSNGHEMFRPSRIVTHWREGPNCRDMDGIVNAKHLVHVVSVGSEYRCASSIL
jgi:hypothetical protein